jgi:NADH:ubiquinone oxidoreductase subunit 5 (subunit L)/multisubunit Na+/H+ antiporter MnhA subunit
LYRLLYNKYYVDQIYDAMFVNRVKDLALTLGAFDVNFINGLGVDGSGWVTRVTSTISDGVGLLDCGRTGESGGADRVGFELAGADAADRARLPLRAVHVSAC